MNELLKNKNYFYFVITYYKERLQKKSLKAHTDCVNTHKSLYQIYLLTTKTILITYNWFLLMFMSEGRLKRSFIYSEWIERCWNARINSILCLVWFEKWRKSKKKNHDFKHSCLQEDQEAELVDTQECVHLFFLNHSFTILFFNISSWYNFWG